MTFGELLIRGRHKSQYIIMKKYLNNKTLTSDGLRAIETSEQLIACNIGMLLGASPLKT